ncbi:MAG: hypothetical protein KME04_16880 [Pleurocapsa minor GSE-CHR-MK-17-07R]|jgi:hypothetical protein|nr:hypothetical protein [Pleurocapsa minor GSE-CHR-MK 17-07R]
MHRALIRTSGIILLLAVLAACNMFAPEAGQQTLSAERDLRGTEVAIARLTATPINDRLNVTLEGALTALARSHGQTTRIAATLQALGTPFVDSRFVTPAALDNDASVAGQTGLASSGQTNIQQPVIPVVEPTIIGQGAAQGNASDLVPPTPTPFVEGATLEPSTVGLSDVVTAQAVGADDCALSPISEFPATTEGVYVVARAQNLSPANLLTARFLLNGVEQVFYTWSPSFNIAQGCIWFYMPAADVTALAGTWTAQIDIDGAAGVQVPFTVFAA